MIKVILGLVFLICCSTGGEIAMTAGMKQVGELNKFEDGANVDETALRSVGLANGPGAGIKILGTGELTKALVLKGVVASASAKAAVEKAGGSFNA